MPVTFNGGVSMKGIRVGYSPFIPSDLFSNGEVGHWPAGYDPAAGRVFQVSDGTSPATAAAQPVGLALDTTRQTTFETRWNLLTHPEDLTNAVWARAAETATLTDSGYTALGFTSTSTDRRFAARSVTITHGGGSLFFLARFRPGVGVTRLALGSRETASVYGWASYDIVAGTWENFVTGISGTYEGVSAVEVAAGVWELVVRHTAPPASVSMLVHFGSGSAADLRNNSPICSCDVGLTQMATTNAAYQPVGASLPTSWLGNHAQQATALSRPTLSRVPRGGRRNALIHTDDLSNSAWISANIAPAQVSGEVWEINEGVATGEHTLRQNALQSTDPAGTAIDVKAGNAETWVRLSLRNNFTTSLIDFNLATFEVETAFGSGATLLTDPVAAATPLEDGWFRLSIRHSGAGSEAANRHLGVAILGADKGLSYTGTNRSILVRRPQREPGNVISPYQRVVTARDVTEAGVPNVWHLNDDGNDSLPAALPAGNYTAAWVNALGAVTIAENVPVTDTLNTLRGQNQADALIINRALAAGEQAALTAYWHARYLL